MAQLTLSRPFAAPTVLPARPAAPRQNGSVEAWLLDHAAPLPSLEALRARNLAAYAYAVLPPAHPARALLLPDFAAALRRHHAFRRALLPLLRGWAARGIPVMLYKGFHLGEMVYPVAGTRFHGDVDVLIDPAHARGAVEAAREMGWTVTQVAADSAQAGSHTLFNLRDLHSGVELDVHRLAVHAFVGRAALQARITRAVWNASELQDWEGVGVRVPCPVDALLVGVVLQRCWGSDRWRLKPHDVLDFRHLAARGVTRRDLESRAAELGCSRTLAAFLGRCDPEAGRFTLAATAGDELRACMRAARADGAGTRLWVWRYRLGRLPRVLRIVPAGWLELWRVRRRVDARAEVRDVLRALTPHVPPASPTPAHRRVEAEEGIRLAARIFPRGPLGRDVLRSLALYSALRRQGWPAVFVAGERRGPLGQAALAWVELDGRPLPGLVERPAGEARVVTFAYPGADEARAPRAARPRVGVHPR